MEKIYFISETFFTRNSALSESHFCARVVQTFTVSFYK